VSSDDQSFTGRCPTCGQTFLRDRVATLEHELAQAAHYKIMVGTLERELTEALTALAACRSGLAPR